MNAAKITRAQLEESGACDLSEFDELFPDGFAELTRENILRAKSLDLEWYAKTFHADVWDEYERKHAPILDEYLRKHAPIWDEYLRKHAPILDEYLRKHAPILDEYERKHANLVADMICTEDGK